MKAVLVSVFELKVGEFLLVVYIPAQHGLEVRYEKQYKISFMEANHTLHDVAITSTKPHTYTITSVASLISPVRTKGCCLIWYLLYLFIILFMIYCIYV